MNFREVEHKLRAYLIASGSNRTRYIKRAVSEHIDAELAANEGTRQKYCIALSQLLDAAGVARLPSATVWYNDPNADQWIEAERINGWLIPTGKTRPFEPGDGHDDDDNFFAAPPSSAATENDNG